MVTPPDDLDAIILGGGAAGLFCAAMAGQRGRRVIVLEHNDAIGRKILISGGGRCNFTNVGTAPTCFISENPDFVRSALARFGPQDFLDVVIRHRIPWYEKTLGQLFCEGAGAARRIVAMLAAECATGGAEIRTGVRITDVRHSDRFHVETDAGAFTAPALVIATGAPPIPKLGATDFAWRLADRFGVPIVAPAPALVPLTVAPADLRWIEPLAGVATQVTAQAPGGPRFRAAALFTHRGLSGPAVLQASTYWRPGSALALDLAPDLDLPALLLARKKAQPAQPLRRTMGELFSTRLADALARDLGPARPLGEFRDAALDAFARSLKDFRLTPAGDEGWAKAEVARGGVDTRALSSRTMEVRTVPGLFFIGEAVDVTGWLGGYNFQWAWSSGWCAAQAL